MCFIFILPIFMYIFSYLYCLYFAKMAQKSTSKHLKRANFSGGGMPPDPPSKCVLCTHILKFFYIFKKATVMPRCFCHVSSRRTGPVVGCRYPSGLVATLGRCWDLVSIARILQAEQWVWQHRLAVYCPRFGDRRVRVSVSVASSTSSPAPATSSLFRTRSHEETQQ